MQKYTSALVGCAIISATMLYLWFTGYGSRQRYDLILNLHWGRSQEELAELDRILRRHTWKSLLASQRTDEGEEGADLSYRLMLRDTERAGELLAELRRLSGVSNLTSITAEDESEI